MYDCAHIERMRLEWLGVLEQERLGAGDVVGLKARYSADAVSLLLALLSHGCIASLLPWSEPSDTPFMEDGQVEYAFRLGAEGEWVGERTKQQVRHPLLLGLRERGEGGFILYTSGSSGRPKAVLHSTERFLRKFDRPGKRLRTLAFLLFDHVAGIDTLFYSLASGGPLVLPGSRDPGTICRLIQEERVQVLPASPTFLNLLRLSGEPERFDLSSLEIITYGSEPMAQGTLDGLNRLFPQVRIIQKYGTSEFGSPRALSKARDSLFVQLDTTGIDAKVVDGLLWIRSDSAMLGYLNADDPFDEHGWICTGDAVEQDGEWIRILGRCSELINVGGEKVYPQEVEEAILELDFIEDVRVQGESHPLTGQIVTAQVRLRRPIEPAELRRNVRRHCRAKLAPYKVPVRVEQASAPFSSVRHKKMRRSESEDSS